MQGSGRDGVAHGFSRGGHESSGHSRPPPLKRRVTRRLTGGKPVPHSNVAAELCPGRSRRKSLRFSTAETELCRYGHVVFMTATNGSISRQLTVPSPFTSLFENGQVGTPGRNMAAQAAHLSFIAATK